MAVIELIKGKKYKIEILLGYNEFHKKLRHYETFYGNKTETKEREQELKKSLKNGIMITGNNMTFQELSNKWLELHVSNLAPKTQEEYKAQLKEINKEIGNLKLSKITPLVLEQFYNKLRNDKKRNLTENTILHYYAVINGIYNKAKKWRLVESNPNSYTERPKKEKIEREYYQLEEVQTLLSCTSNECIKYQAIINLAVDSGAREGELTGLNWSDIDFEKKTISINKVTQVVNGKIIEKNKPKNNSSIRTISLMDKTVEILKILKQEQEEQRKMLGNKWVESGKVFIKENGDLIYPSTPSKIYKKICKKYNIKVLRFHDLRHTSATLQNAVNIPMKAISKRLGHSSAIITDTIYSHVFTTTDKEITNKVSELLYTEKR